MLPSLLAVLRVISKSGPRSAEIWILSVAKIIYGAWSHLAKWCASAEFLLHDKVSYCSIKWNFVQRTYCKFALTVNDKNLETTRLPRGSVAITCWFWWINKINFRQTGMKGKAISWADQKEIPIKLELQKGSTNNACQQFKINLLKKFPLWNLQIQADGIFTCNFNFFSERHNRTTTKPNIIAMRTDAFVALLSCLLMRQNWNSFSWK